MRHDMEKVLTEPARSNSDVPSRKTGGKISLKLIDADDHGSTRLPVSRYRQYGYDRREFGNRLGPLRRFLRANIGRPWNKINSEIFKHISHRTVSGRRLLEHIGWEVQKNCSIGSDGVIYQQPRYGRALPVSGLYVHPINGLLCWQEPISYDRLEKKRKAQAEVEKKKVMLRQSDKQAYFKINGLWYVAVFFPENSPNLQKFQGTLIENLAGRFCIMRKRQLSRKELKMAGIRNDPR